MAPLEALAELSGAPFFVCGPVSARFSVEQLGDSPEFDRKSCLRAKNPNQIGSLQTLFGTKLILLQIRELARVD